MPTKEWQSLQLDLDLRAGTVSGRVGSLEHSIAFSSKPFLAGWPGRVDIVGMDAIVPPSEKNHTELRLPALEFDNFAVSESPIAPPKPVERDNRNSTTIAAAQSELNELLVNGPFPMTYGMAEGTPHDVPVQMPRRTRPAGRHRSAWVHQGARRGSAAGEHFRQRPPRAGELAHANGESAGRASDGQSDLAVSFRTWTRQDTE